MTKKNLPQQTLVVIITLIIVISTSLLVKGFFLEHETELVKLYYVANNSELTPTDKYIHLDEEENMVQDVIERLYLDLPKENLKRVLPDNLEILSIYIKDDIAYIDFSDAYNELSNQEELLARGSIVWSVTSLNFIQGVVIKVDNSIITSKSNHDFGIMNKQNVIISNNLSTNTTSEYQIVNLYFSDNSSTALLPERRLIAVEANKGQERTILEQLISGPQSSNFTSTIPKETKINDVATTSDGVCYVNLNYEFISKHSGGEMNELLTIYSIVNSLCQLNHISKVQFLIDGERLDLYKGYVDFSKPFQAMELLI